MKIRALILIIIVGLLNFGCTDTDSDPTQPLDI